MKKEYKVRLFWFLLGALFFSTIGVCAVAYLSAENVLFTPRNSEWKVSNLKEALDSLYEESRNTKNHEIHGMTLEVDSVSGNVRYMYQGREIYPIYWYGFVPKIADESQFLSAWYEANAGTRFSYEKDHVLVTRTAQDSNNLCVGGFTTSYMLQLGKYKTYHMIVNHSNLDGVNMQYVSLTGALGANQANEKGRLLSLPNDILEPTEFVSNIGNINGRYYLGLNSGCQDGMIDIAAIWLEK